MNNEINSNIAASNAAETVYNEPFNSSEEYKSVNREQIEAARRAKNLWDFKGAEIEKYVADGTARVMTAVLDRATREETGAFFIHQFKWEDDRAFAVYENSFVTTMRRVGRSQDQTINTAHAATAAAELYSAVIGGAELHIPQGNGEFEAVPKSRDEMLEFARIYPESAAEAVDAWLESVHFSVVNESNGKFDWLFSNDPVVKVEWTLGEKAEPLAAGILTFKSPTRETRKKFDEEVQNIKTRRQGDQSIAQVAENYSKKLQYGLTHLLNVEGIAVGAPGVDYSDRLKQDFVIKFNPVWFAAAVETMHESFDFTKGKS